MTVTLLAGSVSAGSGLDPAWVGLTGVIVGAIIAGGSGYVIARMQRKTAVDAEDRIEARTVRRAARLIDADLMAAEVAASTCVESKQWWPIEVRLTKEGPCRASDKMSIVSTFGPRPAQIRRPTRPPVRPTTRPISSER